MLVNVEIIENSKESIDRAYDISISAKEELLVAFPTINSFRRNVRTGISMQLLQGVYSTTNVRFRILTPVDSQIMQIIEELKVLPGLDIRALNESTESNRVTILLADGKESIVVEIKDDTKDNMYDAVGLSIYSSSKSIVSSYLAIFEILWKQSQPLA
ncbi:MAG: hypothetical protein WBP64_12535 [Nitrososphaeraceae archaeon]